MPEPGSGQGKVVKAPSESVESPRIICYRRVLMPTYEYQCETCETVFEAFHSMSAEPLKDCREEGCDGTLRRLIGAGAGLIFKGSGFYITDYRSSGYQEAAKKDKSASSAPAAAPSTPSAPASSTSSSASSGSSSAS